MIQFQIESKRILLKYFPENNDWVSPQIEDDTDIIIKKSFHFQKKHLIKAELSNQDDLDFFGEFSFLFAIKKGDYYKVQKSILIDEFDVYIHKEIRVEEKLFVADSRVSIFKVISKISKNDIYIGGNKPMSIPISDFERLVKYFPNPYEREKYVEARISSILRNYLEDVKDAEKSYQNYLNKKLTKKGINLLSTFKQTDILKYEEVLKKLERMLKEENEYSEHQWQIEILEIVLLLYPKYIHVFKSVSIQTSLADVLKVKQLDFLLVDSNGYIDIIEIKKPFENCIMTKSLYRDNYIPLRELSGTVMQIEKYIYYLNRWSNLGERKLTEKYKNELPNEFNIKIANPSGIIIMGRENNLSADQKRDFEVVKRKYKNVVDIITYDNLIERLKFTIEQIKIRTIT